MRFYKYLYKYWKLQLITILLGFFTLLFSVTGPYLVKLMIDNAYCTKNLRLFLILGVVSGTIFIFVGFMNSINNYLSQYLRRHVKFDITKDLFRHLQSLPLSFFKDKSTGEHIYKINSDIHSVNEFICSSVSQAISLVIQFFFILSIVFYLNRKLALLAIIFAPFVYMHYYIFGKWFRRLTLNIVRMSQDAFVKLHEIFTHISLVKALGKEEEEIKILDKTLLEIMDSEIKNAKLSSISAFSSYVLNRILIGIVAIYGGYQVIKGITTLGSLTAIIIYLNQLMGIMNSFGIFYGSIIVNSISRRRLSEIFAVEPDVRDTTTARAYCITKGRIDIKNITFGYSADKLIFKNLSFSVEPASKIAIVGPSGCGKTTLINLILRLYESKEGFIAIDEVDIREIKLEFLKTQIGVALQETFLWNDTVANNIAYGSPNASKEEVLNAARIAEAHDFIMNLSQQYETVIGEMACKISEGQKQRIAIARAVIKRPKILILDEAMSSLDSPTEEKIMENLRREFNNSTIIVVSHRASTISKMDSVYFLKGPSELEISVPNELIAGERISSFKYRIN